MLNRTASHDHKPAIFSNNTSSNGTPYLLIDLKPKLRKINIDDQDYYINDQHITIFQNFTNFSRNSLYHVTVTLSDGAGEMYKLRAYFDNKDQLIDQLSFKKTASIIGKDEEKVDISSLTASVITSILQAQASKVIGTIYYYDQRHQDQVTQSYLDKVNAITKEYHSLENPTIEYLISIENKIKNLQKDYAAVKLEVPTFKDTARSKLLKKVSWELLDLQLEESQSEKKVSSQNEEQSPVSTPKRNVTNQAVQPTLMMSNHRKGKKRKKGKKKKVDYSANFKSLSQSIPQQLESIDDAPNLKQLKVLEKLLSEINIFCLTCELDNPNYMNQVKVSLNGLREDIESHIKDFAKTAVETNDKEAIAFFRKANLFLPPCILEYAINHEDVELFNAYLKGSKTPINHLAINDGSGNCISLLQYAYQHKLPVIFEHIFMLGGNPFISDNNGLPLLHNILRSPEPIFYPIVSKSIYLMGHKPFYGQLVSSLREYIETNDLSPKDEIDLQFSLEMYRNKRKQSLPTGRQRSAEVGLVDAEVNIAFLNIVTDKLKGELLTEPRFYAARQRFMDTFLKITQSSNAREYKIIKREEEDFNETLKSKLGKSKFFSVDTILILLDFKTDILQLHFDIVKMTSECKKARTRRHVKALSLEIAEKKQQLISMMTTFTEKLTKSILAESLNAFSYSDSNSVKTLFSGDSSSMPAESEDLGALQQSDSSSEDNDLRLVI